jgi:hypothetical protein
MAKASGFIGGSLRQVGSVDSDGNGRGNTARTATAIASPVATSSR